MDIKRYRGYICCSIRNTTMYLLNFMNVLVPQVALLYVCGFVLFFFLRSRKMRHVYHTLKNMKRYETINRKIKLKGLLALSIFLLWLNSFFSILNFFPKDFVLNYAISITIFFVSFYLGLWSGLWLSDDEEFENQKH